MKIKIFVLFITILLVFCGCQATPEEKVVISKGDNNLQKTIESTPVPTTSDAPRQFICPDKWVETYEITKLDCNIDAQVIIPVSETFPVYKVKKRNFDAEIIGEIIKYFSAGASGVRVTTPTKEELEQQLILTKRGAYIEDDNGGSWEPYDGQQQDIANLEEQIKNAQSEVFNPLTDSISLPLDNTYAMADGSRLYINASDNGIKITTEKFGITQPESWIIEGGASPGEPAGTTLDNVNISEKEAREKASEVISVLGIKNMGIAETEKGRIINTLTAEATEGWIITLTRNDGSSIPVNLNSSQLIGMLDFKTDEYVERWYNEAISIFVDEVGVRSFFWSNPLEVVEIMNSNVALLPFNDIKERIKMSIKFGYSKRVENGQISSLHEMTIPRIILTNVLVPIKDDLDNQMLLPAWLVYYMGSFEVDGIEYEDPLAIFAVNAVDGSSIDLTMRFRELRSN